LEASNLLTRFVTRTLASSRRSEVEEHVVECDDCRAWVTTFSLLAQSLGDEAERSVSSHPSSLDLSTFALAAHTLDDATRERCATHVRRCATCRREVELVGAAVSEARQGDRAAVSDSAPIRKRFASPARLAWAAGLLLAIGGLVLLQPSGPPSSGERQVQRKIFHGSSVVRARDFMLVEETKITSGAEVSLEAGRAVAFGNGFSVGSGASLSVLVEEPESS